MDKDVDETNKTLTLEPARQQTRHRNFIIILGPTIIPFYLQHFSSGPMTSSYSSFFLRSPFLDDSFVLMAQLFPPQERRRKGVFFYTLSLLLIWQRTTTMQLTVYPPHDDGGPAY